MEVPGIAPARYRIAKVWRGLMLFAVIMAADRELTCAQSVTRATVDDNCTARKQRVAERLSAAGEAELEPLVVPFVNELGAECVASILNSLAVGASIDARTRDVIRFAEQSLRVLQTSYPPDHPLFLQPLALVAGASLGSQDIAKFRRTVQRLRAIGAERPEDKALIHRLSASLFRIEGKWADAESEIRAAMLAEDEAGHSITASQAWLHEQLCGIYLAQGRYIDARRALTMAMAIVNNAPDATALDRVRLLVIRGVLHAKEREWSDAERTLHDALDIADAQPRLDPAILRSVLTNYALALRKTHHRQDARSVAKRLAALPREPGPPVADLIQLAPKERVTRR